MRTQLEKAREPRVEEMLHIEDTCWALIGLLSNLGIESAWRKPPPNWDMESPHSREIVSMWYQLYMERHGT